MILVCSTQVRVSTANFCEVVNVIMMSWGHWCEMLTLFWPFEKSGLKSHSLGLFQTTPRGAETSLALGKSRSQQLWVGFIRPARSFLAVASLNVNYGNQLPLFYFYLHLFSFVYLCLLLFIQTGIPLGSECELWKSVAFISIYTCFLLFTYVYFCLSKPVFL